MACTRAGSYPLADTVRKPPFLTLLRNIGVISSGSLTVTVLNVSNSLKMKAPYWAAMVDEPLA